MKEKASVVIAVIGDLVGSREHASREMVQRDLLAALDEVNQRVEAEQPLEPTIGDEFQGVYRTMPEALRATLLLRLTLPERMDARFGLGVGSLIVVGESAYGLTQDGPAWWAARSAVGEVATRQKRLAGLRTWAHRAEGGDDVRHINAYTLCRDQIVSRFDGRERRIALGALDGLSLTAIAEAEDISASAVSQRYRRGINALVASVEELQAA